MGTAELLDVRAPPAAVFPRALSPVPGPLAVEGGGGWGCRRQGRRTAGAGRPVPDFCKRSFTCAGAVVATATTFVSVAGFVEEVGAVEVVCASTALSAGSRASFGGAVTAVSITRPAPADGATGSVVDEPSLPASAPAGNTTMSRAR